MAGSAHRRVERLFLPRRHALKPLWPGFPAGVFRAGPLLTSCVAAVVLASPVSPALAQRAADASDPGAESDTGRLQMRVAVAGLVGERPLVPEPDADPVWQLDGREGHWLLQVPLSLEQPERGVTLEASPIGVRPAVFRAWRLPRDAGKRDSARPTEEAAASPGKTNEANALPSAAPRLFDEATLDATGRLTIPLTRTIPGLTVRERSDNPYTLKIRPQRLGDMRPERPRLDAPARPDLGDAESPQEARSRRRDYLRKRQQAREAFERAQAKYREELQAYRQRVEEVRGLPGEFAIAAPDRLWAVFEVRRGRAVLTMTGPSASLPWQLPLTHLARARQLAGRNADRLRRMLTPPAEDTARRGFRAPDRLRSAASRVGPGRGADSRGAASDEARLIGPLLKWARDEHVLTHRLLAHALAAQPRLRAITVDGPRFELFSRLLDSDDKVTRRITLELLTESDRESAAVARLLQERMDRFGPADQRGMLSALFGQWAERDRGEMALIANTLLQRETGPPPNLILRALLEQAEPERLRDRDTSRLTEPAEPIAFAKLSEARQQQAIATVIEQAPKHRLARWWLSRELLGAANAGLVDRALHALASAELTKPGETGLAGESRGDDAFAASEGAWQGPAIRLTARIPLERADHPLLAMLTEADEPRRPLAWRALTRFSLAHDGRDAQSREPEAVERIASAIARAARETQQIAAAITVLRSARQDPGVAGRILDLAVDDEGGSATLAVHAVLGGGEGMRRALRDLAPGKQKRLIERLYALHNPSGHVEAMTPLLKAERNTRQLRRWLVEQIAAGELPAVHRWLEQLGGVRPALEIARNSDQPKTRRAVAAVLVASIGAEASDVDSLARRFQAALDAGDDKQRTPSIDELREAWTATRRMIHARWLESAAGRYRLVLVIPPAARTQPTGSVETKPARVILGQVELTADGQSVRLATRTVHLSVAASRFAIRLDEPSELTNFDHDRLTDAMIQPPRGESAVLLTPADDAAWEGTLRIDGRSAKLRLEPVGTGAP